MSRGALSIEGAPIVFGGKNLSELDSQFLAVLTHANVAKEFDELVKSKFDIFENRIKIAVGCDNIDHIKFKDGISKHSALICDKGTSGKYCFSPFCEIERPKPPYTDLAAAKAAKKVRVLSISTIQDTIFQKLIANVVCEYAEKVFANNIDLCSYGYRVGKSSKMAVKRIRRFVDKGYTHILDGDIQGFFDEIDHALLVNKMRAFFGADNELVQKLLYRFINVKRIPIEKSALCRKGDLSCAEKRLKGIPQGGVLSGLLANVFLYDFDLYILNVLMPQYEFRYFRYADDFVLMFKESSKIKEVYELLRQYLESQKLVLHPLVGKKTSKIIDLSNLKKETLDFLGFKISAKYLKIKNDNITKFKNRIVATLRKIEVDVVDDFYFSRVITCINAKIVGIEDLREQFGGVCPHCNKLLEKRSWIGYFLMIDDVRSLRNIDTIIRTAIYDDYYRRTKKHLRKQELLAYTRGKLKSVERIYFDYKKQIRQHEKNGYCKCLRDFGGYYDRDLRKILISPHSELSGIVNNFNEEGAVIDSTSTQPV